MRPEEIAASLRRAVRERLIVPGQVINQDELARRYGVSRIPLREALRTLVGEGLVIMKPGLGAIVTELDGAEVDELYGLRLQLEPPLAEAIVDRVARRDVTELRGMVERLADLDEADSPDWFSAHYAFNRRLYELSGRRHALRLVVQVLNLVEPYARMHSHMAGARRDLARRCGEIAEAVADGDAELLRERIETGLRISRESLVAALADAVSDAENEAVPG